MGDDDEDDLTLTGKDTLSRQMQMMQMQRVLRTAGWMDNSVDGYTDTLCEDACEYITHKSSNAWQTILTCVKGHCKAWHKTFP